MTTAICCACNVFFSQKRRQGQQRSRASGAKGDEHGNSLSSLDLARRRLERYILDHKVSSLEGLQSDLNLEDGFSMSSAEIVTFIEELENGGRVTGIWINDARGGRSFLRLSLDELRRIASFINEKGRVTVEELTIETNRILEFSPSSEEEAGGRGGGVEVDVDDVGDDVEETATGVPEEAARINVPTCEAATGTDASSGGRQRISCR